MVLSERGVPFEILNLVASAQQREFLDITPSITQLVKYLWEPTSSGVVLQAVDEESKLELGFFNARATFVWSRDVQRPEYKAAWELLAQNSLVAADEMPPLLSVFLEVNGSLKKIQTDLSDREYTKKVFRVLDDLLQQLGAFLSEAQKHCTKTRKPEPIIFFDTQELFLMKLAGKHFFNKSYKSALVVGQSKSYISVQKHVESVRLESAQALTEYRQQLHNNPSIQLESVFFAARLSEVVDIFRNIHSEFDQRIKKLRIT